MKSSETTAVSSTLTLPLRSAKRHTYGQILKSSIVIGGASVLNIGIGIIRAKAMALLLGPAGVGLLGLYASIADLARTAAGMGINSSGVRQIAQAVGSGDTRQIARTVIALRRVAMWLGVAGALLLVVFCQPVSRLSFGDSQHAAAVASLALAVLFGAVAGGQIALVQGMRRIKDLALINVLGAVYGLLVAVPLVYWLGEAGIVPALVAIAAVGLAISWWYSRKIQIEQVTMRWADLSAEVSTLLQLGFVLMVGGLMMLAVGYVVRIVLLRTLGADAAGFYQAAWALGGVYVGIILQAMGADFFPRLTAAANDNAECNRLVNEQAEVSLLLAGPGIIATLTMAPWVIQLFYSAKFGPAVEILRWISLGMMLRVASWPIGCVLLAKGARQSFFWSELASNGAQVGLAVLCVLQFGLKGAGIAFFASYLCYCGLIYVIVHGLSGFRWSAANQRIGLFYGTLITALFIGGYFVPPPIMIVAGGAAVVFTGLYSVRRICALVPITRFPQSVQRLLAFLRLTPPPS